MDPVDLALVIALDGSASVTLDEFNLIAGGMAAGLRDPEVAAGLTGGARGASLLALLLWSGPGAHEVMLDWTRVATLADVDAVAQAFANVPRIVPAGETAIGEALLAAEALLDALPAPAQRRVIDVVGDGRSKDRGRCSAHAASDGASSRARAGCHRPWWASVCRAWQ